MSPTRPKIGGMAINPLEAQVIRHPERMTKVDPRLVAVVEHCGASRDLVVLEGARSVEDQQKAIDSGHSSLKDPMKSKHVIGPGRPLATAVDLASWPLDWTDLAAFDRLAVDMKASAQVLEIPITWGGDWVRFVDRPHYQLKL